jgi:hypothetical protein
MDYEQFWRLVDLTRGFPERAQALAKLLEQHEPEEIVGFRILYDDIIHSANKVDLWGAAHTINGGCSDDGFYYFREALIELGRTVFEAAVSDPDTLADITNPGDEMATSEGLGNAATMAWIARTGGSEEAFYEAVDNADTANRGDAEEGEWWNFNRPAEVRHRLPRLAAKFLPQAED